MISLEGRTRLVWEEAWRLLPAIKREASIVGVQLADLGAVHGTYHPDSGLLELSTRLFWGRTPAEVDCLDVNGDDPPKAYPLCSRALHTCLHEAWHAIGYATGLDEEPGYLALSGWVKASDDPPGYCRYWERRPGWDPQGPSEWRYRLGSNWFVREYSTKSPFEAFADSCTHITLGWDDFFGANGQAELRWLRRNVFGETGLTQVQAARQRWEARYGGTVHAPHHLGR